MSTSKPNSSECAHSGASSFRERRREREMREREREAGCVETRERETRERGRLCGDTYLEKFTHIISASFYGQWK